MLGAAFLCLLPLLASSATDKPPKIVNGTLVGEPIPYQVSIRYKDQYHWCGGTILSPKIVLSAAHCFDPSLAYTVLAGANSAYYEEPTWQKSKVAQIHFTSGDLAFNAGLKSNNDIAVLELATPLTFNRYVNKAELPAFDVPQGQTCYVSGWGALGHGMRGPEKLMYADVPVLSDAACTQVYRAAISKAMFCAGGQGKDACQGDSGGPLVCYKGGQPVLTGIVSWGHECGSYPGVYTRVYLFLDFIKSFLGRA